MSETIDTAEEYFRSGKGEGALFPLAIPLPRATCPYSRHLEQLGAMNYVRNTSTDRQFFVHLNRGSLVNTSRHMRTDLSGAAPVRTNRFVVLEPW